MVLLGIFPFLVCVSMHFFNSIYAWLPFEVLFKYAIYVVLREGFASKLPLEVVLDAFQ